MLLFKAITKVVVTQFKKWITVILESVSSAVYMWASLLAIFAAVTLTGLLEINVKPTVQVLKPTYIVQKEDLRRVLLKSRYPLTDSLINSIFNSKSTVIVDIPDKQVIFLKWGEVISGIYKGANGTCFSYKELTNGSDIFRSQELGYSPDSELKGVDNSTDESEITISSQDDLQPYQKRIQVMPFFMKYIVKNYGSDWLFLTTDSLLKIDNKFASIETDPPLFLSSALLRCRRVFSIISIENSEAFDVNGLQLRIYKKHSFSQDDRLKLEAWSIGESIVACQQKMGKEIAIQIPNLHAKSDIQLIVSSWLLGIKNEDIILTYEKLKSINTSYVWVIVLLTLLLSAVCRFTIGFLGQVKNTNHFQARRNRHG